MIKRKISAKANNGELKLKITINYESEGLMQVEARSKVEYIKNELHDFLRKWFYHSEIKIK